MTDECAPQPPEDANDVQAIVEPAALQEKTSPTDRFRGGNAFVEKRSGAFFGRLGYLAGLGWSSPLIAEEMGDGVHPSYVRTLIRRWGFSRPKAWCLVPLTNIQRRWLAYKAEKEGVTPEEWLRRHVVAAVLNEPGRP